MALLDHKQRRQADAERVTWWNERYRVGQRIAFSFCDGRIIDAKTVAPAQMLGGVTPIIWIDAAPGPVSLDRVMGMES